MANGGAHQRLAHLWDALEKAGAQVTRIPLHTITAHTAGRIAAAEERRLRILAEAGTPGPTPRKRTAYTDDLIRDLAHLLEAALKEAS